MRTPLNGETTRTSLSFHTPLANLIINGELEPQHPASLASVSNDNHAGDQTFSFSLFNRQTDNSPKLKSLSWRGICELLAERRLTSGTSDGDKDGPAFSGATYPPGKTRRNANVQSVSLAILDFDDSTPLSELESIVSRLNDGRGTAAIFYSTFSHDPQNGLEKYRLVMPLATPVPGEQWPTTWGRLTAAFGGKPDTKAKDASRMHFLPSCHMERAGEAVSKVIDGAPLDVATLPLPIQKTARYNARKSPAPSHVHEDKYARKAFDNALSDVQNAKEGERNDTLNKAAFALGRFVGAGRLSRSEVEQALQDAACSIELPVDESWRTVKSDLDAGEREPNYKGVPATKKTSNGRHNAAPVRPDADLGADEVPPPAHCNERGIPEYAASQLVEMLRPTWNCASLSTHAAHAQRIIANLGEDVRFCPELGWLGFNGRRWEQDDRHATQTADRAKNLSCVIQEEGASLYNVASILATIRRGTDAEALSKAAAAHTRHAKQAENKTFVEGALYFASGNSAIRVLSDTFDQRAWLIGFQNGVWDKGTWREHRRDDFLLHLCPITLDLDGDGSEWENVLNRITGGDSDFGRSLQDVAGYILSGASHLRFLPWLYGPKGTGKSTFAELLQTMLGKMAITLDPKKLQEAAARERLGAELWNRRLAVCAEAGNQKFAAELLKTLSGSDVLTARLLYQETFSFQPRHVLLMIANDAPHLNAYDDALKDRVVALPFVHCLGAGAPLELTGGVRVEAVRKEPDSPLVRGFALWALEGLERVFRTQTISRSPCMESATARFWVDIDPLTPFWETLDATTLQNAISKTDLR